MKSRVKDLTFIGFVEDNNDPKKLGRCKVRVHTIFDDIPTEDLPWAAPFKDLNGNIFNAPEVGKVVTIIFDNGNIYKPEFIYADHYNINLENKLKALSEDDYITFKSVFLDESTQIYRSKSEGLKIDHEYTNINLDKNGSINLNLRDNSSKVNIGSPDAAQSAILGTNFMDWLDRFVDLLVNNIALQAGGMPVTLMPDMADLLFEYQSTKDEKFLSKNVWLNANSEVLAQNREHISQSGDKWKSTVIDNKLVDIAQNIYTPQERDVVSRPVYSDTSIPADTNKYTTTNEFYDDYPKPNIQGIDNGRINVEQQLKKNKNLDKYLSKNPDAPYLLPDASDALDALMAAYELADFPGKQKIVFTDGYRNYDRQVKTYEENFKSGKNLAAKPGNSPHGLAIAVDMYWGVKIAMTKDYDKRPSGFKHPVYKWLLENAGKYGWFNPQKLRDDSGKMDEWWHWEYHGTSAGHPIPDSDIAARYKGSFAQEDIDNIKSSGGSYPYV